MSTDESRYYDALDDRLADERDERDAVEVDSDGTRWRRVRECTCGGTAPGYPQHEANCGWEPVES